ncbi:helix-turn-helix domain-containing protein [Intestinimonas butyriciproducens]|uniref:helix-turn-helix domain-containing protein n=1 Tax=Intestinimonas butyriciproducens TaxID=1297617 RepID=UPI0034A0F129
MSTIFRIRELRQERGMTQAQLAKGMGLRSPSAITMWETGDRNPPSSILPQLANVLACTIDELYIRELLEHDGAGSKGA